MELWLRRQREKGARIKKRERRGKARIKERERGGQLGLRRERGRARIKKIERGRTGIKN